MKLYRIYRKEAFVTRLELETVEWDPPTEKDMPPEITIVPGVPIQECEMIAAHWAERRIQVPAHDEDLITVTPEWQEQVARTIPGFYKDARVLEPAHYERKSIWIPEHKETTPIEVPGYYETRYRPTAMAAARGLSEPTEPYQFWVDSTWYDHTIKVPGEFRMHRVWVPERWVRKQVWVPEEVVWDTVTHPEETITTIVAVPIRVERQKYWQEEYEQCWLMHPENTVVAGYTYSPEFMRELGEWFAWYQTTMPGQFFIEGAKTYGWLEEWTNQEVLMKAWHAYRRFQPDVSVRILPDITAKFNPAEIDNMLRSKDGIHYLKSKGLYDWARRLQNQLMNQPNRSLTEEEKAMLIKVGAWAVMVAAAAVVVYYFWPGAKFEVTITYPEPVYVGRYLEQVTQLDLVGVSANGRPLYVNIGDIDGQIMGETRSVDKDQWSFGENWKWSAWAEEARYMGVGETRYWTEVEVEYLGIMSRVGALYFILHAGRMDVARGGHEPGWSKKSTEWGSWEEVLEHIRI